MLTGMCMGRDKEHSTIIYESPQPDTPLLRLGWNKQDPRYMATLLMDCSKVVVLDIRYCFLAQLILLICIPKTKWICIANQVSIVGLHQNMLRSTLVHVRYMWFHVRSNFQIELHKRVLWTKRGNCSVTKVYYNTSFTLCALCLPVFPLLSSPEQYISEYAVTYVA